MCMTWIEFYSLQNKSLLYVRRIALDLIHHEYFVRVHQTGTVDFYYLLYNITLRSWSTVVYSLHL